MKTLRRLLILTNLNFFTLNRGNILRLSNHKRLRTQMTQYWGPTPNNTPSNKVTLPLKTIRRIQLTVKSIRGVIMKIQISSQRLNLTRNQRSSDSSRWRQKMLNWASRPDRILVKICQYRRSQVLSRLLKYICQCLRIMKIRWKMKSSSQEWQKQKTIALWKTRLWISAAVSCTLKRKISTPGVKTKKIREQDHK